MIKAPSVVVSENSTAMARKPVAWPYRFIILKKTQFEQLAGMSDRCVNLFPASVVSSGTKSELLTSSQVFRPQLHSFRRYPSTSTIIFLSNQVHFIRNVKKSLLVKRTSPVASPLQKIMRWSENITFHDRTSGGLYLCVLHRNNPRVGFSVTDSKADLLFKRGLTFVYFQGKIPYQGIRATEKLDLVSSKVRERSQGSWLNSKFDQHTESHSINRLRSLEGNARSKLREAD